MFGLPSSTFYHPSFMYLPSQEMSKTHLLTSTSDGKRKQSSDKCQLITKKFCPTISDRPVKKCSFSIDSLLENKTPNLQISNRSYNEDTEDGSSDDGQISFRSPPISSYALFNQIKTLDMSTTTKIKADLTASSESESDHSPYRLNPNKHLNNNRHGINHKTKPKRIRTIFTPEQLERLESEFDKQQYMVGNERFYLATTLDLTEAQVKVWFQNRRIKWRRQALDDHQQRITSLSGTITSTQAPPSTINDDDDDPHSDSDE